ncbi:MAG: DUF1501 domain-containing protein [Gammaproteobacteria bacterium PRO9]|nr:DUF1501 domain-containing protein [Gammaproteobacteria bacterium PRO9]
MEAGMKTRDGISRRHFLWHAALASAVITVPRFALAAAPRDGRLVVILLRGALDGLSAVPPHGDPDYQRLRGALAIGAPGTSQGALPLDQTFGLHPGLGFLHEAWAARELTVFHAVATPYRQRSHFDGQDVLENGLGRPHETGSGWLNRALATLPGASSAETGVALGDTVPLVMRGPARVASWSPSRMPEPDDDTLQRLADLYADDAVLGTALAGAMAAENMADAAMTDPEAGSGRQQRRGGRREGLLPATLRAVAGFLARPDGPRVAVLDTRGWDTHAREGAGTGQLATRLGVLDDSLRQFRQALGETWSDTAVLMVTEFGRMAAANGTGGTDHGTAAAALLVGGAVEGGHVVADWPGLSPRNLHEGRDVAATLDLRSVFKGLLVEQLGVSPTALERDVFPGSHDAKALRDLVRSSV